MKTKSILLIGLGRFGRQIATKLAELGHEVMAVDKDENLVNNIMPVVTNGQIGDSTNEEFLDSLGVCNFDVCIVAIGSDFQSSLLTTCLLKEMGAKKVVSRAEQDGQAKLLLRNGADDVVYPEKQLASWLAIRYSADHILDYIELDGKNAIFEVTTPPQWCGKSIAEIDIRRKFNINILAIKKTNKFDANVSPDTILTEDISLLVFGDYKSVQKCFHL